MLVDQVPASGPLGERPLGVATLSLDHGITVTDLVSHLGLKPDAEYFAMVNEEHVAIDQLAVHQLQEGDSIVLCPPLKGG